MKLFSRYKQQLSVAEDFRSIFIVNPSRDGLLDGVRAMAIMLVILLHCTVGITKLLTEEQIHHYISQLPAWLNIAWQARGSDIIFILCGYLVTQALIKEYKIKHSLDIKRFYIKRLYRIYPLFLAALMLYLLIDADRYHYIISNLLFISNLVPDQKNIIPIGWSLNVQMQFYALLPFLLLFTLWCQQYLHPIIQILILIAAVAVICAVRFYVVTNNDELLNTPFYEFFDKESSYASNYGNLLYYNLYTRLGPFLLGATIAYLIGFHQQRLILHLTSNPLLASLYFLAGCAIVYCAILPAIHNKSDTFYQPFNPLHNLIYLTFNKYLFCLGTSIILATLLVPTGITKPFANFLSIKLWQPLSKLIYPIYLFHFPFIVLAAACVFQTTDKTSITTATAGQLLLIFAITTLLTMAFSVIPYVFIERPFIRLSQNHTKSL